MTTKKKQQKTMLKMKKAKKNRMFEEFLASTVMTHHSNGCLFYFSVEWGWRGGLVFISALTISLIKSVEPLLPPFCCHQRLFPQNTPAGSM